MKGIVKGLVCSCLAGLMLFSSVAAGTKDEVVYANLNPSGNVEDVYIVNILGPIDGKVEDFGEYTSITNMTDPQVPSLAGDKITVDSNGKKVYLQGTLAKKDLPWDVAVDYYLDGNKLPPEEMAGKSGKVEIRLSIGRNNGITKSYYEDFVVQTALTLDSKVFSNVESNGGTISNVGADKQISYMSLPGKGLEAAITADAIDFELGEISFNAISLNLDLNTEDFDLESFTGDLSQLEDGVGQLNYGAKSLSSGFDKFAGGVSGAKDGASSLSSGLDALASNNGAVIEGAQQLSDAMLQMANSQLKATLPETKTLTWDNYSSVLSDILNVNDEMRSGVKKQLSSKTGLTGNELDMLIYLASSRLPKSGVTQEKIEAATSVSGNMMKRAQEDMEKIVKAQKELQSAKGNPLAVTSLKNVITKMIMEQNGISDPTKITEDMLKQGYNKIAGGITGAKDEEKAIILVIAAEMAVSGKDFTKAIQESGALLQNAAEVELAGKTILTSAGKNAIKSLLTQMVKLSGGGLDAISDLLSGLTGTQHYVTQIKRYTMGVSEAAKGVGELRYGLGDLASGAGELKGGISKLEQGTKALLDGTSNMDEEAKKRIDEAIGNMFPGNPVISFASDKNGEIGALQFSMKTEKITKEVEQKQIKEEKEGKGFMEKLKDLF